MNYNAVGNILGKTRLGSTNTNSYTYPLAGQPRPYAVSGITGVVNGVTNPTFTYDANGNRLTGGGRTLTWTSFNKVATITEGSTSVAFVYDAEHQRLKQTSGSNTIVYLNDPISGTSSEKHSASGGTWKDSIFADGERISVRTQTTSPAATSFQYFVQDHLGSVAVVMNQAGSVVQRLSYDAWGMRRQPNGTEDPSGAITAPTSRGYTDHEHLDNVDLINMNARMYDPETARFLSADPIIPNVFQSQALNRYSYVLNNPGSLVDPTGYQSAPPTGNPVGDIIITVFYNVFKIASRSDSFVIPTGPYHVPGIASVSQNMAGSAPIYDVSAGPPIADGTIAMGGAKYVNGADSEAAIYVAGDGLSWIDKAHLVLNGASIVLDATGVGAVVSWIPDVIDAGVSAYEGDWTGAGMSVGAIIPGVGNAANIGKMGRIAKRGHQLGDYTHNYQRSAGASQRIPQVLQSGGHTLSNRTSKGLNDYFGEKLTKREWGRALEGLKKDHRLGNDHHGRILDNGDYINEYGELIGNISHYLP